jgi:hypothetical protein
MMIEFFYVFNVPGPILRHLGELGKIRLLLGGNTSFLAGWVSKRRARILSDFRHLPPKRFKT